MNFLTKDAQEHANRQNFGWKNFETAKETRKKLSKRAKELNDEGIDQDDTVELTSEESVYDRLQFAEHMRSGD